MHTIAKAEEAERNRVGVSRGIYRYPARCSLLDRRFGKGNFPVKNFKKGKSPLKRFSVDQLFKRERALRPGLVGNRKEKKKEEKSWYRSIELELKSS